MTRPFPVIAAVILVVGLAAPAFAQKRKDQWCAPVRGLQARLWMRGPTPGVFSREKPLHVQFQLRNAGETPVTLPNSGYVASPSLLAVTLHLTDPCGVERELDLGTTTPETPRTGACEIAPGRAKARTLDLGTLTQSQHWDWWQGVGLPAGAYELAFTFRVERPVGPFGWHGAIRTNTVAFTVAEGSVYPEYQPDGEVEILSRGPDGLPTHVAWRKGGGVVRERLISDGMSGWPRHLIADIVHAALGKAAPWTSATETFEMGGATAQLFLPRPDGHRPTALVRTWGFPVYSGAVGVLTARYVDGRLHGPFEGRYRRHTMRGEYIEGRREGTWVTRSGDAVVSQQQYRDGVLHGASTGWHRTGVLRHEAFYRHGALHGAERRWSPRATLLEVGHWTDGRRDGRFESWYRDGTPRRVSSYANGVKTGTWRWYRKDGTLAAEGAWKNGAPWSGTFYWPNRSRALRPATITRYEDGQLVQSWSDVER